MPNPGSDEAIKQGCTCPVLDNAHGKGIPTKDGPMFWIAASCPLHGSGTRLPVIERKEPRDA